MVEHFSVNTVRGQGQGVISLQWLDSSGYFEYLAIFPLSQALRVTPTDRFPQSGGKPSRGMELARAAGKNRRPTMQIELGRRCHQDPN
jgi:hypothetical protein